jgi:hypothetical protein
VQSVSESRDASIRAISTRPHRKSRAMQPPAA